MTLRFTFLSVCGIVCNQVFFIIGLSYASATAANLVMQLSPCVALAMCALIGFEARLTVPRVIGAAVAGVCAVLMISGDA